MPIYNKIVDKIYSAGNGLSISLNVTLNRTSQDGTLINFYNEYMYYSTHYSDEAISIKRDYSYNLSVDINNDMAKAGVFIRAQDMINLINGLNNAADWYGGKVKNLYATREGKLVLLNRQEPIKIANLISDNYIMFEPCVYCKDDVYKPGLRFYINEVYSDISLENFMGLLYIISKLDMYGCALLLVNSLNVPKGTNLSKIENSYNNSIEQREFDGNVPKGRQISGGKKKNFFDAI